MLNIGKSILLCSVICFRTRREVWWNWLWEFLFIFYSIGSVVSKALLQPHITFRYSVDIFVIMLLLWNLNGYALEWLYLLCLCDIPIKDVGSGLPTTVTFLKDSWNHHASFWLWCFEGKVCMILIKPWISSSIWNISNKDRMHVYIITTTLLTVYYSDMFQS